MYQDANHPSFRIHCGVQIKYFSYCFCRECVNQLSYILRFFEQFINLCHWLWYLLNLHRQLPDIVLLPIEHIFQFYLWNLIHLNPSAREDYFCWYLSSDQLMLFQGSCFTSEDPMPFILTETLSFQHHCNLPFHSNTFLGLIELDLSPTISIN